MLHIISSPNLETAVLQRMDAGDSVLFIANAVFNLTKKNPALDQLIKNCKVYALQEDILVRGLNKDHLLQELETIDYSGFVRLVETNEWNHSWS